MYGWSRTYAYGHGKWNWMPSYEIDTAAPWLNVMSLTDRSAHILYALWSRFMMGRRESGSSSRSKWGWWKKRGNIGISFHHRSTQPSSGFPLLLLVSSPLYNWKGSFSGSPFQALVLASSSSKSILRKYLSFIGDSSRQTHASLFHYAPKPVKIQHHSALFYPAFVFMMARPLRGMYFSFRWRACSWVFTSSAWEVFLLLSLDYILPGHNSGIRP